MLSETLKPKSKKWKWTPVNAKTLRKDANFLKRQLNQGTQTACLCSFKLPKMSMKKKQTMILSKNLGSRSLNWKVNLTKMTKISKNASEDFNKRWKGKSKFMKNELKTQMKLVK
jgi:hypothetical protein